MRNSYLFFSAFIFVLFSFEVNAQDKAKEFQEYYNNMANAAKSKDYAEASEWGEKARSIAPEVLGADTENLGTFLNNLAKFYQADKGYEKSIEIFEQAIAVRKVAHGEESAEVGKSMYGLALSLHASGDTEKAESNYLEAMRIFENTVGKESADYKNAYNYVVQLYKDTGQNDKLNNLLADGAEVNENDPIALIVQAGIFQGEGKYQEAEELYLKGIKLFEEKGETQSNNYITANLNLASLYYAQENYNKALPLYETALKAAEQSGGTNSKIYAIAANGLALEYEALLRFEEAAQLYETSLQILESKGENNSPEYAKMLNDVAGFYRKTSQYEKAENLYKDARKLRESLEGNESNVYAETVMDMALLYYEQRKYQEALPLAEEALQIRKNLGNAHPLYAISLYNTANILTATKNYNNAEEYYKQALAIQQNVFGVESLESSASLNNLGELYEKQGRYIEAENAYLQALEIRKKYNENNKANYIRTLENLANLYVIDEKYEEAAAFYQEVVKYRSEQKNTQPKEYAQTLNQLAGLEYVTGQFEISGQHYEEALQIYEQTFTNDDPTYINNLNNLAGIYQRRGRFVEAEELLEKARTAGLEILGKNHPDYSLSLNNLATLYKSMGEYSEAEAMYSEVLVIRESNNDPEYARTLNDLALLYEVLGKYSEAEPLYKKALEARKQQVNGENTAEYANILNNLGKLYRSMGRYNEAETYFLQALDLRKQVLGDAHPDYAATINALASLYQNVEGKQSQAEELYAQALEIRKSTLGQNHPDYASSLDNLATFYQQTEQYEKAIPLYEEALQIRQNVYGKEHPSYASSLNNLAFLYENMGKYDKAEPLYQETIEIFKRTLGTSHPDYAITLNNLASFLYKRKDDYSQAEPLYREAVDIILEQIDENFSSLSEEEKKLFFDANKLFLDNYMLFVANAASKINQGENIDKSFLIDAYNLQLATKGLLLNATSKIRKRILASGDKALIKKYKDWQDIRELIAKIYNLGESEAQKKGINIKELENKANQLERELSSQSVGFAEVYNPSIPTWEEIRDGLQTGEAALELVRIKADETTVVYAALIVKHNTQDYPEIVVLQNGTDLETRYLSYYKNTIRTRKDDKYSYNQFWRDIQAKLEGVEKVFISPDGAYNQLNLNTLKIPTEEVYLVDKLDIVMLTSTKEILEADESNTNKDALLFGNPKFAINVDVNSLEELNLDEQTDRWIKNVYFTELPGSEREINNVASQLESENWKVKTYLADAAEEENIKKVKQPAILHIATHGFFVPSEEEENQEKRRINLNQGEEINPMLRSGLVLAGVTDYFSNVSTGNTRKEDGILTAFEAANLALEGTQMIILSACETGLGAVRSGEGVYGLQRAFKIAGARVILMSLWKVDDNATQELMRLFYEEWLNSQNPRESLKIAQQKLREKAGYEHPFFWGAFTVIGK